MSDIGVVLRVPQGTHAKFKVGCAKNDRSMQKVLLALIEGWVANGSPDPASYGQYQTDNREGSAGLDREARDGIIKLAKELSKVKERLTALEEDKIRKKSSDAGMKELYEILKDDDETGEANKGNEN